MFMLLSLIQLMTLADAGGEDFENMYAMYELQLINEW